ncbi:MAG: hypothetical protein LBD38_05560 [Streptococcaceae bacterium]|jgi:DNA polymerase-3 subunit delta'|nr:hypothetical protein [Streptococcaceae bacterium]
MKNQIILDQIEKTIKKKRLMHAYLLEGKNKIEMKIASNRLIQSVFCQEKVDGLPCGRCSSCMRVISRIHPDVLILKPNGANIRVDDVRAVLIEMSKTSMEGGYKALLIEEAEKMNASSSNALLKFLEEPLGKKLLVLETENKGHILPTILSRVGSFHFLPMDKDELANGLKKEGVQSDLASDVSVLVDTLEEGKALAEEEGFQELRERVLAWGNLVLKKDGRAFINVSTSISPFIDSMKNEEKKQAQDRFFILARHFFEGQPNRQILGNALSKIEEAKVRVGRNVVFRYALESMTLDLLN